MLLVIFFFNFETYSNSYFIIIAFSLYGYFTGLLKLIYHDPRPFLTSA